MQERDLSIYEENIWTLTAMYMRPVRRDLADAQPTYRESFQTICVKWPVADEKFGLMKL